MGACDSFILKGDAKGYANCVINTLGLKPGDECMGACHPFIGGALSISRISHPSSVHLAGMTSRMKQRTCEIAFSQRDIKVREPVGGIGDIVTGLGKAALTVGAIAGAVVGIGAVVGGAAVTGTAATIGGTVATAGKIGMAAGKGLSETVPAAQEPAIEASQREAKNPCIVKEAYKVKPEETPTVYEEDPYRV